MRWTAPQAWSDRLLLLCPHEALARERPSKPRRCLTAPDAPNLSMPQLIETRRQTKTTSEPATAVRQLGLANSMVLH